MYAFDLVVDTIEDSRSDKARHSVQPQLHDHTFNFLASSVLWLLNMHFAQVKY